jgi:hypothetical protein
MSPFVCGTVEDRMRGKPRRDGKPATPAPTDPVDEVAARLRAGEISPAEALEQLIDETVRRQAGEGGDALRERLRALLRRQAEIDPYLATRLDRLGRRS